MIGPPAKATSMRTDSGDSGNGDNLRENAVNGVGMDKGNLQTEETATGSGVDQLCSCCCEVGQSRSDVVDLVRNVVHARASLGKKASYRSIVAGRGEQLDPALAERDRRRLDALVGQNLAMLERAAEEYGVRLDGFGEVGDGETYVMNGEGLHAPDATPRRGHAAAVDVSIIASAPRLNEHHATRAGGRLQRFAVERADRSHGLGGPRLTRQVTHHREELLAIDRLSLEESAGEPVE